MGDDPAGLSSGHRYAGRGLRRLDGRHDHRRRHLGRPVRPGTYRRAVDRRRLAAQRRHLGHGPVGQQRVADRRRCSPCRPSAAAGSIAVNPTVGNFRTSDGRWINFTMLQPGRYWADLCKHLGLEHLVSDERFDTAEKLMANAAEAGALVAERMASETYAYWMEHLQTLEGQWAPNQDPLELGRDRQVVANGYVVPGHRPGRQPARAGRQPGAVRGAAARDHVGRRSSPSKPTTSCGNWAATRNRSST